MNNEEKSIVITGGLGGVATVVLQMLNKDTSTRNKNIVIVDVLDEEIANKKLKLFPNLNIQYVQADFKLEIQNIIYEYFADTVIHLVAESSQPILMALESLGKTYPEMDYLYLDASNYLSLYSGDFVEDFNLASNFEVFNEKFAGARRFNHFKAFSSFGGDPGVLSDNLWKLGMDRFGGVSAGLVGAYVIEHDTLSYTDDYEYKDDIFYTGWSGEANVSECRELAQVSTNYEDCYIDSPACEIDFKFQIGDNIVTTASAVIHDETHRFGKRFGVECAFLYSQNEAHREKIKRKTPDGKFAKWDEYHVYSPLHHTMKGGDKLGVKLVYSDGKEINIYNETTSNHELCDISNPVSIQVGLGVWAGLIALQDYRSQLPIGLYWAADLIFEDFPQVKNFNQYMLDLVKPYMPLRIEIFEKGDGLLSNRFVNQDQKKPIIPIMDKLRALPFSEENYNNPVVGINDIHIQYVEEFLLSQGYNIKHISLYILSGSLINIEGDNEDDFYNKVLTDFIRYVGDPSITDTLNYFKNIKGVSMLDIPTSYVAEVLFDEGFTILQVNNFIIKHGNKLLTNTYYNEEFLYASVHYMIRRFL